MAQMKRRNSRVVVLMHRQRLGDSRVPRLRYISIEDAEQAAGPSDD